MGSKSFLITLLFLGSSFLLLAQKTVVLSIDHFFEGEELTLNVSKPSSIAGNYEVSRLEYYISKFKLSHDGDQLIQLPDTWLLVNGANRLEVVLGEFQITELEKIQFGNGVDSNYNNLDPTLYPAGHPLALGVPSMHWGWSAGYRFLVFEGKVGQNLENNFAIHALGNRNFREVGIATPGRESNDTIYVELDAHCEGIFREIDFAGGLNAHGEFDDARQTLINLQRNVFVEKNAPSSITEVGSTEGIELLYHQHKIEMRQSQTGSALDYSLFNMLGQKLSSGSFLEEAEIHLEKESLYLITFSKDNETISTEKVLVY